ERACSGGDALHPTVTATHGCVSRRGVTYPGGHHRYLRLYVPVKRHHQQEHRAIPLDDPAQHEFYPQYESRHRARRSYSRASRTDDHGGRNARQRRGRAVADDRDDHASLGWEVNSMTDVRKCCSIGIKEVQGTPAILVYLPRVPGLIPHLTLAHVSVVLVPGGLSPGVPCSINAGNAVGITVIRVSG